MKIRSEIIWGKQPPYVRKFVTPKGKLWYQVDNRKAKTDGKRERFKTREEAEERARELTKDIQEHGHGATLPFQLRAMSQRCAERLEKHGKTIEQATDFFIEHLEAELVRSNSATVSSLVDEWLAYKASGNDHDLKPRTLADLEKTGNQLKTLFPHKRIAYVETKEIENFLHSAKRTKRTKNNLRNRIGQFFNWAVSRDYLESNPASGKKIRIKVPDAEIVILPVEECEKLMTLTETPKHKALMGYFAITLFAGVRPHECQKLRWENVHLETRQIFVHKSISKISEDRHIHIEENLLEWLKLCAKKKGFVAPQEKEFRKLFDRIRREAGFKVNGTREGNPWTEDCCRHSYATFWLPANEGKRSLLAEYMGNSWRVIGKHYKAVVPATEVKAFWSILPKKVRAQREAEERARLVKEVHADTAADHRLRLEYLKSKRDFEKLLSKVARKAATGKLT